MANKKARTVSFEEDAHHIVETYPGSESGPDFSYRLNELVVNFSQLVRYTRREIAGVLNVQEAKLILDAFNGTIYLASVSHIAPKTILISSIADSIELDGLDGKWDVERKSILTKLDKLTEFQAYVVLLTCAEWWDSKDKEFTDGDIRQMFMIRDKKE